MKKKSIAIDVSQLEKPARHPSDFLKLDFDGDDFVLDDGESLTLDIGIGLVHVDDGTNDYVDAKARVSVSLTFRWQGGVLKLLKANELKNDGR